jgi:hypothetical protein
LVGISSTIRISFRLELDITAFKFQLKAGGNGSKVGSTREFYNDPIARLGAAILQIAREILD